MAYINTMCTHTYIRVCIHTWVAYNDTFTHTANTHKMYVSSHTR